MMRVLVVLGVAALTLVGCKKETCLGEPESCHLSAPCPRVTFTCDASLANELAVETLESAAKRPAGWNGLGSTGDVKLSNGFAEVVIAGIGHQNYLDPNGGSILDLSPKGGPDTVNNLFQVVGILPRDAAFYTSLQIIDERPNFVAVEVKGTLDGRPSVPVLTRYELRNCDRGVRVRTEILNGSTNTETWSLVDGFYFSGRESLPFAPGPGSGFIHPSFGLTTINAAYRTFPYVAAGGHSNDEQISAIGLVSCDQPTLEGFHSDQISAAGLARQIVPPRGSLVYERFFTVAGSKGVSGAIDLILEVRQQTQGERFITVRGTVERMGTTSFNAEREASLLISEGTLTTDLSKRVPWSQVVPDANGSFSMRVPVGKSFVVEAHAFGRKQIEREYSNLTADTDLGAFVLPATGTVTFQVTDRGNAMPIDAELFLVPADDAQIPDFIGTVHGRFATCAPWLGSPTGASPACNRVLVHSGTAVAEIPLGRFDVYAFHGPYWSLAKQTVNVVGGPQSVSFSLTEFALKPAGVLSADLHVHGSASFDSSIPDRDRVLSFAATDLDVVVGTDHEVVSDYARIVRELGLQDHLSTIVGVETTGHIPFLTVPGYGFPLVIGHYNLWPLRYDPSLPRNGGPFDERVEPGQLFDRAKPLFTDEPVIELNHPWADPEFGRDLGFPRAILMDLRRDLPTGDDGTRMGVYVRTAPGADTANDGHHAQEVMNGTDNGLFLQYRAFWHYTLNQGRFRAGTANSDSHSLTDNTVGMPHNLVFAPGTSAGATFDVREFNRALKAGHTSGTNGPIIEAALVDGANQYAWGRELRSVGASAKIHVKVSSAPWIPVDEVRFVVNGKVAKTITGLPADADPFSESARLVDYEGDVSVSELVAGVDGDAWIVVEAGRTLLLAGDLGGGLEGAQDGMPDTTDNDGNGVVDIADVKAGAKIGPLADPPKPTRGQPGYEYSVITNGYPSAFTNPFLLDRNGDAFFNAPGVKGGRP